jgi:hypothetical protein
VTVRLYPEPAELGVGVLVVFTMRIGGRVAFTVAGAVTVIAASGVSARVAVTFLVPWGPVIFTVAATAPSGPVPIGAEWALVDVHVSFSADVPRMHVQPTGVGSVTNCCPVVRNFVVSTGSWYATPPVPASAGVRVRVYSVPTAAPGSGTVGEGRDRTGVGVTFSVTRCVVEGAMSSGSFRLTVPVSVPDDVGETVTGILICPSVVVDGIAVFSVDWHVRVVGELIVQVQPTGAGADVIVSPGFSTTVSVGSWWADPVGPSEVVTTSV